MDAQRRYQNSGPILPDVPRSPQPLNIPTPTSSQLMPIDARFPPPPLPPINAQSLPTMQVFPLRTGNQPQMFDDSINQSLYKVKQLESRLQMTEISNRALLEEVIRLQTELFNAIRQSQSILQEERLSRQHIENNIRIQNDVILQLTARIKRNEDVFNDEHQSSLSANASVRGLEQQIAAIQKEYVLRRDTQSMSVDGIRKQLGETNMQREQLEKIQFNLVEELRSIRNRLEAESSNFNSLTNEVRQKTRKLEDDQRLTETTKKSAESLRKLNDGITLIEQQTDENRRKIEKVLDAEIKSRKQQYKELADIITKTDEKSNYQIATIQASIATINTRIADLRDLSNKPEIINLNRRLDTMEHTHRETDGNIQTLTNHLADLSSRYTATDARVRQTEDKIKVDEQTVRDLAARVALLPTTEDITSVRRELSEKIRSDLQKGLQQQDENLSQALVKHEQRINSIRVDLNVLEEQISQRMAQNEQLLSNQIRDKQADNEMWRREVDQKMARLMNLRDTLPQEIYSLNEKLTSVRQECMKFSQEENFRTKDDIERLRKDMGYMQRSIAAAPTAKPSPRQDIEYKILESEVEELYCEVRALRETYDNILARLEYDNTNADSNAVVVPTNNSSQLLSAYWNSHHPTQ
ncbi:unnamed protein product [Rotaria magnacalcarata]|uniref:Uncharacterized protein n=1 Tax=Rotaria magnacalcarata TaxID=392030 RepID=A0A8S2NHY0_9BILA|nr:unnamed protein product [Rotaria magnacalcarata]